MPAPAGASDDFGAAYRDLFTQAMGIAYRIVGDRVTAQDVAAEALARAFASWGRVRARPNPAAWVMRVAANLAIDHVRRKPTPLTPADTESFEEMSTLRLALATALASLPRRQRDALVLHFFGGMSEVEVSASMGIAASTVRSHVQMGLGSLRRHLGADPETSGFASG
jgi:RNA polymerase sigma-70 factor (ECF subfamily)